MIEIDLHYRDRRQIAPMLRVREELRERGMLVMDRGDSPPAEASERPLLIQHSLLDPAIRERRFPILVLEQSDAAVCWDRASAVHRNVVRVFKIGTLVPPLLHDTCRGRYHSTLIDPTLRAAPSLPLRGEHLARLTPLYNYAVYDRLDPWALDPPAERERHYGLNFIGTVDYGPGMPEITEHRRAALREAVRVRGRHLVIEGRPFGSAEYGRLLRDSHICLSPWGLGEICHRDVEAMFSGCVLLKPDTSFVETWPPLFRNGVTYIPCRIDFSDLGDRVEEVLDHWRDLEEMRERNRLMLLESRRPAILADRLLRLLSEPLERASAKTAADQPMSDRSVVGLRSAAELRAAFKPYGDIAYEVCPICEGPAIRPIWKIPFARLDKALSIGNTHLKYLPTFGATTIYDYSQCDACGSIFLNPYRSSRKDQYASVDNPGARAKVAAADPGHPSWKSYSARYRVQLRPWMPERGALLVDAACGGGQYLQLIREDDTLRFDRLVGLELSPLAVAHLQSLGFEACLHDLDSAMAIDTLPNGSADFVIFSEAFEHVVFPGACLRRLVEMLKPSGRLFFSAQRIDEQLPVRPGENHCLSARGLELLIESLKCTPLSVQERPGKWLIILEKH